METSVITFVGKSNSGKTTLLESIIPILKKKGYRVGTLKHDAHRFDIDHEGKDTWKMAKAGADTVVISAPDKLAMIKKQQTEATLDEIIQTLFADVDIVIIEGYKMSDKPKIEVIRFNEPVTLPENNLIAIVDNTDGSFQWQPPENYRDIRMLGFDQKDAIVRLIEDRIINNKNP